jgi:hypothetical protein
MTVAYSVHEITKKTDAMHKDLLELISTLSEATISDKSSSVDPFFSLKIHSIISQSGIPHGSQWHTK